MDDKITWSALEYEEKDRSADWFWALGVIVVASSAAAIIYGNYFFAALIILSGILLWIFAVKQPGMVTYEFNQKGLKIRHRLFLYENIKSFYIQVSPGGPVGTEEPRLTLFIKSERLFMPILSMPVDDALAEEIYDIMAAKDIPEEEMTEHPFEKILEYFGF